MPNEVQLLTTVANSSAGVLEMARLREEKRKHDQLEAELKQARVIQMGLVPARPLRVGPWEAAGHIEPARTVGGDAFSYYPLARERLAVAIADVSGKGVPAALLMSGVQASLRAFCDGHWAIPDAMRHLNQSVVRSAQPGKFITLFYAEVEPQSNRLRYSNAGHNYPLLRRADGTIEPLKTGGLPLGLFEDTAFAEGETGFAPGDSLLLFSDGVSEALDVDRREFGDERLERIWREIGHLPPTDVLDRLLAELAGYRGSAEQSDDVTMVVVGAARG
jgi:serine phosphatase RsbU (regulator of sigma subunit)